MMPHPALIQPRRIWFGLPPLLAAFLLSLCPFAAPVRAGETAAELPAALLTRDLGDPRAPGNVKLVLTLPEHLARSHPAPRADDFLVYVYPYGTPDAEAAVERHRAHGLYLWRSGKRVFIDARQLPLQDRDGPAEVRVVFAPDGVPLAEGVAEGDSSYAAELADVILAVDVSRSMLYNDPRKLRVTAARAFIEMARMGGGIGRVGLVTFNHRAYLGSPLIPLERGEELLAILGRVGAEGLTSLDAPLRMGMRELLDNGKSRRPVIILLSDGKNEGSRYQETHRLCAEAGVRLFTVGLAESADHALLAEMADSTGGSYFRAPRDADLPEIYARLAAELGKRRLLDARLLTADEGEMFLPIDASVKRFVAMADAGAKIGAVAPDASELGGESGSLFRVNPEAGDWLFTWNEASPDLSALALFGETQFFLDAFPPQLRGDKLAVGATLAMGDRPLAGGGVWVEPIPGATFDSIKLFDDGLHGDGEADDGVYGAVVDFPADAPDRFDIIIRAEGAAWDLGEFVRQNLALTIRSREPPPPDRADIDGELDFGVLFPGETGTAAARIELQAPESRDLFFELVWDAGEDVWPELAARVLVEPGARSFELEMAIPETARPGSYDGTFDISDGGGLGDRTQARVKVGTVRFGDAAALDLGDIPPGTFAGRELSVTYDADKAAPLLSRLDGPSDLAATVPVDTVAAGAGDIRLEVVVSVPIDREEGEYAGVVHMQAGPGALELPVRWRVKAYAVPATARIETPEGVPTPPELPDITPPPLPAETPLLAQTRPDGSTGMEPPGFSDVFAGDQTADFGTAGDSPWERTTRALGRDGQPDGVGAPSAASLPSSDDLRFPSLTEPAKGGGDSFWSAWWLYLLALLLLLLLLLLLIAYILYRLGKSQLARLLLVSALVNLILLAIFIALLGAVATIAPTTRPTVSVTLVEDDYLPRADLSDAEKEMLGASGASSSAGSVGGEAAAAGEIAFDNAPAGGEGSDMEKTSRLPEPGQESLELADAREPSAAPLDARRLSPLTRRERRNERSAPSQPQLETPDTLATASANAVDRERERETGERRETAELAEARADLDAAAEPIRSEWSDSERLTPQAAPAAAGAVAPEVAGMETVSLEPVAARVDPRGRRRNPREASAIYPEPRVDIADPVRDAVEAAALDAPEMEREDPGVAEIRSLPRSQGSAPRGEKPGVVASPGVAQLESELAAESRGETASAAASLDLAASRGGRRSARGGALRSQSDADLPAGAMPGGGSGAGDGQASASASARTSGGRGEAGVESGEQRYDEPAGGGGGSGRSTTGAADRPSGGGGSSASPSPFHGGGGGERMEYSQNPGGGDGQRGLSRRRGHGGDNPDNNGSVPGGRGGDGREPTGPGEGGSRRGDRRGTGEGRYDDMAAGTGGGDADGRGGPAVGGLGSSRLASGGSGDGLDAIPLETGETEWRRNDRRGRRRSVSVAASSLEVDSLLIVVGDFAGAGDAASENLFAVLSRRLARGLVVEERRLSPADINLADCLLAVLSPEEARSWSEADIAAAARYLAAGGHIWMDAARPSQSDAFMERLAAVAGGTYGPLPEDHQLAEGEKVDAIFVGGKLAAVTTYQDWRRQWRHDTGNGRTLRFLIRGLNYFLSGNAETGIVLDTDTVSDDLYVEPASAQTPDTLAGIVASSGRIWDDFGPASAAAWRLPGWSDPGGVSAISDGRGGRALKLDLNGSVKGRAAVSRTLSSPEDFSAVRRLDVEVYYDGRGPASMALVLTLAAGNSWLDFEMPAQPLAQGWNRLRFELNGRDFRNLTGGGDFDSALPQRNRLGRIGFFLYRNDGGAAATLFRDLRLYEE